MIIRGKANSCLLTEDPPPPLQFIETAAPLLYLQEPTSGPSVQATSPQPRPHHLSPGHVTSAQATSPQSRPHHLSPGHITSVQATSPQPRPHHLSPGHVTSVQATSPQPRPHHLSPGHITPSCSLGIHFDVIQSRTPASS